MANRYGVKRTWENKKGERISYLKNYQDACMAMGLIYNDATKIFFNKMESYGHSEKSICYAAYRVSDEVVKLIHKIVGVECRIDIDGSYSSYGVDEYNDTFFTQIRDILKKYSWENDNPKWIAYCEKKKIEEENEIKIKDAMIEDDKLESDYNAGMYPGAKIENKKIDGMYRKVLVQYYVYFIQGESGGAIKIGLSNNPQNRLKVLQTGYPDTLKILAIVVGDIKKEKLFHKKYDHIRLNGEWFKPAKELMDEIKHLQELQENIK